MRLSANLTVTALATSHISSSPYFMLTMNHGFTQLDVRNCRFNRFTQSLVQSYSKNTNIHLKSSFAANFLRSVVHVNSLLIYREDIKNAVQNQNLGAASENVICQEMRFINCTTQFDGGAIFCVVGKTFYCNFTAFDRCFTQPSYIGGAIYCIANQTNFTGDCFTQCYSRKGLAIMNPLTEYKLSMELCQIDNIKPDTTKYTKCSRILEISARDIYLTGSNCSKVALEQITHFTPSQNFFISYFNFQDAQISSSRFSAMFLFSKVNSRMNITQLNFINLNMSTSLTPSTTYLFNLEGFSLKIEKSVFVQCNFDKFAYGESLGQLILSECTFDFSYSKVSSDINISTPSCKFDDTNAKPINMDAVSTKGCWAHSTYKWQRPPLKDQAIILAFMAAAVILAIILVICKKRSLDKAKPQDDDDADFLMADAQ